MATVPIAAISRLTSTAGRHRTVPSLMTYAPAGRATTPKPPPSPSWPRSSCPPPPPRTTHHNGRGDNGDAVLLVGFGEHPPDGDRIADAGHQLSNLHGTSRISSGPQLCPSLTLTHVRPVWERTSASGCERSRQDRRLLGATDAPALDEGGVQSPAAGAWSRRPAGLQSITAWTVSGLWLGAGRR